MTERGNCRAIVKPVEFAVGTEAVGFATASCAHPAILETLQPAQIAGRFSIFAADPVEMVTVDAASDDPIARLIERVGQFPKLTSPPCEFPFAGGWIGHISYEAGIPRKLVEQRESAFDFPLLRFGLYDHLLVFDHIAERWWASAIEWEGCLPQRSPAPLRLKVLRERVEKARRLEFIEPAAPMRAEAAEAMMREPYDARVKRIKQYIEAGDIYQANLAQRFRVETDGAPFDLYRRVRSENPSPYAAFLSWDDRAIISASPELFLDLRGNRVVTRPIKGTRPRCGVEAVDSRSRIELETSEKERSELNMIIDLLRNDLGRVCEYGTVRVSDAGSIEAHPTVFHRVATIEGRLAGGKSWSDLLGAAFPGGSIVGAPRIRAMQIIRELEPFARGPYCGAIGWIGLDRNMTLSIAIRTMVWRDGTVDVFAGGAIVAESNADAEYKEILAKAAGLLRSLNAEPAEKRARRGEEVSAS